MRTTDLFKNNRSAKKLNESLQKTFGKHIDLKSMDLSRLEDARNKLRTQLHDARSQSGFNENLENEAMTQAQWMLDAINAEIAERQEFVADPHQAEMSMETNEESNSWEDEVVELLQKFDSNANEIGAYGDPDYKEVIELLKQGDFEEAVNLVGYAYSDQDGGEVRRLEAYLDDLQNDFEAVVDVDAFNDQGGETDDSYALASAGFGSDEDYGDFPESIEAEEYTKKYGHLFNGQGEAMESAPPTAKGERMVKHIKKGYAKNGKLTDKEKSIAYATAWKQHNKANESDEQVDELKRSTVKSYAEKKKSAIKQNPPQNKQEVGKDLKGVKGAVDRLKGVKPTSESVTTGEDMTKLNEGEIQQASAIVNAKTMVDRVGRWIEELSGMENDTLLQLGDSIRDEMSAELAKTFISSVAPAIQQALETLKGTRETLASSVRMLTGEEQSAEMIGAEPAGDLEGDIGGAEPDMMNAGSEDELGAFEEPADEFGASDAAAGGLGDTGRAQRESIDRSNNLLRILAG